MSTWQVTKRLTGEVVYAYTADEPVEWPGMEFSTHNHLLQKILSLEPVGFGIWSQTIVMALPLVAAMEIQKRLAQNRSKY